MIICIINILVCRKKHRKPAKPKLTIQIAAESEDSKAKVEQIPIVGSAFCDENSAHIAYGGELILSFEKLVSICDLVSIDPQFASNYVFFDTVATENNREVHDYCETRPAEEISRE